MEPKILPRPLQPMFTDPRPDITRVESAESPAPANETADPEAARLLNLGDGGAAHFKTFETDNREPDSSVHWQVLCEMGAAEPKSFDYRLVAEKLGNPIALEHACKLLVALLDENIFNQRTSSVLGAIVAAPYSPGTTAVFKALQSTLNERIGLDSLSDLRPRNGNLPTPGYERLYVDLLYQYAKSLPVDGKAYDLYWNTNCKVDYAFKQIGLLGALENPGLLKSQSSYFFRDEGDDEIDRKLAYAQKSWETQEKGFLKLAAELGENGSEQLRLLTEQKRPAGNWRYIEIAVRTAYRRAAAAGQIEKPPLGEQEGRQATAPQWMLLVDATSLANRVAEDYKTYKLSTAKMTLAEEKAFQNLEHVANAPSRAHAEKCALMRSELEKQLREPPKPPSKQLLDLLDTGGSDEEIAKQLKQICRTCGFDAAMDLQNSILSRLHKSSIPYMKRYIEHSASEIPHRCGPATFYFELKRHSARHGHAIQVVEEAYAYAQKHQLKTPEEDYPRVPQRAAVKAAIVITELVSDHNKLSANETHQMTYGAEDMTVKSNPGAAVDRIFADADISFEKRGQG